jgi:hypothetical protein
MPLIKERKSARKDRKYLFIVEHEIFNLLIYSFYPYFP